MVKRFFLILSLFPALAAGAPAADQSLATLLRAELEAAAAPEPALRGFYAARDYQPVWLDRRGPRRQAHLLWQWLSRAGEHGLDPADYAPAELAPLWAGQPAARARLELELTRSYRRLARHLGQGRWDPDRAGTNWHIERPSVAPLQRLANVSSAADLQTLLQGFAPEHSQYRRLQQALARYRTLAKGPWPRLEGDGLLRLGDVDPQVETLRRRLRLEGYPVPQGTPPGRYDSAVRSMVRAFQEDRGLRADGIVGPRTRAALNTPPERIAAKIAANLERWRWLPHPAPERHLRVNVADYTLRAVEQGRVVRSMRVVAGRPERPTPVLGGEISHLVFRPRWTVPPSILQKDLAPQELRSPGSLAQRGFRVYRGWSRQAEEIAPKAVDWQAVAAGTAASAYRVVQQPGPNNALGRVKFMFPNRHSIYLHDTPARNLFDIRRRAFSSGCVRVQDPQWLAGWLLQGMSGWDQVRVQQALHRAAPPLTVVLERPVPVYLGYWTTRVGRDGRLQVARDVYDRDAGLVARFRPAQTPAPVAPMRPPEQPRTLPVAAEAAATAPIARGT